MIALACQSARYARGLFKRPPFGSAPFEGLRILGITRPAGRPLRAARIAASLRAGMPWHATPLRYSGARIGVAARFPTAARCAVAFGPAKVWFGSRLRRARSRLQLCAAHCKGAKNKVFLGSPFAESIWLPRPAAKSARKGRPPYGRQRSGHQLPVGELPINGFGALAGATTGLLCLRQPMADQAISSLREQPEGDKSPTGCYL